MKKLRKARRRLKMSQFTLSKLTGISQSNISKYELGKMIPSPTELEKLEQVLQLKKGTLALDVTVH